MTAKTPSPFKFPFPLWGYSQAEVSIQGGNNTSNPHLCDEGAYFVCIRLLKDGIVLDHGLQKVTVAVIVSA